MKKSRVLSLALVAAMCFSLLAGCGGGSSASPSPSASAPTASQPAETGSVGESGEITIALITNTTGDYAQYGIPVHNGAKLYIDQLNANGGINGKTIKVLEYDDKADGIETVNAFNLAMDNGITASAPCSPAPPSPCPMPPTRSTCPRSPPPPPRPA